MAHAQQHQVAASNTAHALAVDCHAGVEHALYHRTHGLLLARQLSGQMLERMETMADGVLLVRRELGHGLARRIDRQEQRVVAKAVIAAASCAITPSQAPSP